VGKLVAEEEDSIEADGDAAAVGEGWRPYLKESSWSGIIFLAAP
jgi:hypothetical protein